MIPSFSEQDIFLIKLIALLFLSIGGAGLLGFVLGRSSTYTRIAVSTFLNVIAASFLAFLFVPVPLSFQDELPDECRGVFLELSNLSIIGGCESPEGFVIWDDEEEVRRDLPENLAEHVIRVIPWWRASLAMHYRYRESIASREPEAATLRGGLYLW